MGDNKPKIMLVEDDQVQSMMYETAFSSFGYELIVVNKGKEAIKLIKKHKPDLLFLDLLLGEVSGLDILEEIKSDQAIKDLKVIIISNFTKKGLIEECREKGALDFIVKSKHVPKDIVKIAERHLELNAA